MRKPIFILCAALGLSLAPAATHADSMTIDRLAVLLSDPLALQNVGLPVQMHAKLAIGVSGLLLPSSTGDSVNDDGASPGRHRSSSRVSADDSGTFLDVASHGESAEPGEVSRERQSALLTSSFAGNLFAFNLGPENMLTS